MPGIGNRELEAAVRALVYEVDPHGFVQRARKAAEDRGVSVRPLPDVMAVLSARLPAAQAIAAYASIDAAARLKRASGDPRTVQQLRADERLTGRTVVDGIDVEVGLVITDSALFAGTSDPAELVGYGPVPADCARAMLRPEDATTDPAGMDDDEDEDPSSAGQDCRGEDRTDREDIDQEGQEFCPAEGACTDSACTLPHGIAAGPATAVVRRAGDGSSDPGSPDPGPAGQAARVAKAWVRRLYTDPVTGVLVERDPRRRFFTGSLRAFVVARDRTCRTTWCGAAVRAVDHVVRHSDGGPTIEDNGQGTCERCNLARERPRVLQPSPLTYRPPPLCSRSSPGRAARRDVARAWLPVLATGVPDHSQSACS